MCYISRKYIYHTVKHVYNEHAYNEFKVITKKCSFLIMVSIIYLHYLYNKLYLQQGCFVGPKRFVITVFYCMSVFQYIFSALFRVPNITAEH